MSETGQEELGQVIGYYLDNFNPTPSPMLLDELKCYTRELSGAVVLHALQIALDEHEFRFSYIRAILRRYSREKLTSLELVEQSEKRFEERRSRKRGKILTAEEYHRQPKKTATQEDWDKIMRAI